eukprot:6770301-Prorocentrum_lima.AAC.1
MRSRVSALDATFVANSLARAPLTARLLAALGLRSRVLNRAGHDCEPPPVVLGLSLPCLLPSPLPACPPGCPA